MGGKLNLFPPIPPFFLLSSLLFRLPAGSMERGRFFVPSANITRKQMLLKLPQFQSDIPIEKP
jgi:hypothetical protein